LLARCGERARWQIHELESPPAGSAATASDVPVGKTTAVAA